MNNPPAFPIPFETHHDGMTLRDYFAAQAVQFLLGYEESNLENDAKHAYAMADAMLKARET